MKFGIGNINAEGMKVYRSSDGRRWMLEEEVDLRVKAN